MPNEKYAHPLMSWDKVEESRFPEMKLAKEGKLEDLLFFDSKKLIGATSTKNTNLRTAVSQDKAYEILAKQNNMAIDKVKEIINLTKKELSELNKDTKKQYQIISNSFNKYTKDSSYLPISLPVSMAITAYARIRLYELKKVVGEENLLYSDTDSIFTTLPLPESYVGDELGKVKLEYIGEEGIFLAPKVYCIRNILESGKVNLVGKDIEKVKGLTDSNLGLKMFERLLQKNAETVVIQKKLIKRLELGTMLSIEREYSLMITENKRAIIWHNEKYAGTKPFIIGKDSNLPELFLEQSIEPSTST